MVSQIVLTEYDIHLMLVLLEHTDILCQQKERNVRGIEEITWLKDGSGLCQTRLEYCFDLSLLSQEIVVYPISGLVIAKMPVPCGYHFHFSILASSFRNEYTSR